MWLKGETFDQHAWESRSTPFPAALQDQSKPIISFQKICLLIFAHTMKVWSSGLLTSFPLLSPSYVLSSRAAGRAFFQISSLGAFHGLSCYLDSSHHPPIFALHSSFQLSWCFPLGLAVAPQGICQRWICQGRNNSHPCELREHKSLCSHIWWLIILKSFWNTLNTQQSCVGRTKAWMSEWVSVREEAAMGPWQ